MDTQSSKKDEIMARFGHSVKPSQFPVCPRCKQQNWSRLDPNYGFCQDCIEKINNNLKFDNFGNNVEKKQKKSPENPSYFHD